MAQMMPPPGRGFPSRKDYTFDKLVEINGTKNLELLINEIVHSRTNLELEMDLESDLVTPINRIIRYDGYELNENERGEYIVTGEGLIPDEDVAVQTAFENIQSRILEQLDQAKFSIWASVAWFTDRILFEKLIEKAEQGVNVQLVINNDETNANAGFDFESHFETYRKDPIGIGKRNMFHEKFCVIDLKKVIAGSYNWTNSARYNRESINIIEGHATAEEYAERFIQNKQA
jgi:phosphatidylserine/phosphatidylglycerophosphate/cardiolipin synthase-like enzyme